jgi:hypothetical protein
MLESTGQRLRVEREKFSPYLVDIYNKQGGIVSAGANNVAG